MTDLQQKILNDMLRRQEKALFLQDVDNNKETYNIVGNIMELLLAGAKPSDYNIYGRILKVAIEMHENLMSPFFEAKDYFIFYIRSIIEGESKKLIDINYKNLINEVSNKLLQGV